MTPILMNHDHTRHPIGEMRQVDGRLCVEFTKEVQMTHELFLEIFGNPGFRILETECKDGIVTIQKAEILEFSFSPRPTERTAVAQANTPICWMCGELEFSHPRLGLSHVCHESPSLYMQRLYARARAEPVNVAGVGSPHLKETMAEKTESCPYFEENRDHHWIEKSGEHCSFCTAERT